MTETSNSRFTEKAEREIAIMKSWFRKDRLNEFLPRPASKSDFDQTAYAQRGKLRVALGYLLIRELPVKSFYIRSWIMHFYVLYFLVQNVGRGFFSKRPTMLYNHEFFMRPFQNYPDLFYWSLGKVVA